jgi:hypothetical protein
LFSTWTFCMVIPFQQAVHPSDEARSLAPGLKTDMLSRGHLMHVA